MKPTELAGCVIFNEAGELLLLHRSQPNLTQWEIPGGKVEADESAEAAAVREAAEELGIQIAIVQSIGKVVFNQIGRTWHYEWFEASIEEGAPEIRETATFDEVRYMSIESIRAQSSGISPNVQRLVAALKEAA